MTAAAADHTVKSRRSKPLLLALVGGLACAGGAYAAEPMDATAWLRKIAQASRQINYAGTFVYQHGRQVETSHIAHWADAGGDHEKLETLDGPPREIIRTNDNVTCYLPDTKTVVVSKRHGRQFPGLLPEHLAGIAENYVVRKGDTDRVAGAECQMIMLEPKDDLRYGHRFCAELASGLLLRARVYREKGEMVESFAFTQLVLGSAVTKDMLKSKYAAKSQDWRVDRTALERSDVAGDSGWVLKNQLQGFRKITEIRRAIPGRPATVSHIVYSDGLAAISVFIEPMPKTPPLAGPLAYQGAVNVYVQPQADQMLTVVGETPARTVRQVAETLIPRDR
jgi:sigma-E factor negative regulatory protein RseB